MRMKGLISLLIYFNTFHMCLINKIAILTKVAFANWYKNCDLRVSISKIILVIFSLHKPGTMLIILISYVSVRKDYLNN